MLEDLSSEEYSEWVAYDRVEPFGHVVEDHRNALLCSMWSKGKMKDFLFTKSIPAKPKTEKEKMQLLAGVFGAIGINPMIDLDEVGI